MQLFFLNDLVTFFIFLFSGILLYFITSKIILNLIIFKLIKKSKFKWDDVLIEERVFTPMTLLVPLFTFYLFAKFFVDDSEQRDIFFNSLTCLFIFITIFSFKNFLNAFYKIYQQLEFAQEYPLHRSYLTIFKIIMFFFGTIAALAILFGQSPWGILTGLGALSTVLVFIFRDTLLSFVSSIHINNNKLIQVGDWIESPQLNVDGDVIDMHLHLIRVQNWDKTIITVPTYKFLEVPFKNWRGIQEAGGRRIKRSLYIDQTSIKLCDEQLIEKFKKIKILRPYLESKLKEIEDYNKQLLQHHRTDEPCDNPSNINLRRITNIGTFRAYIEAYLQQNPLINHQLTLMVRQLSVTAEGLPLEVYAFTKTTQWKEYEQIQSDIFDHLFSIVNQFDLRIFQSPSGNDIVLALRSFAQKE